MSTYQFNPFTNNLDIVGDAGVTTVGNVGSSPNAAGADITGGILTLEPADATHPGVITTGTQTIAGAKTLSSALTLGSTLSFGSNATLSSGNTDPSITALAGNAGDTYFSTLTKSSYVKFDNGTTTNWIQNSPVTTFVFQPGGTARQNVYTSWASLYAALSLVEGLVDVVFDNTHGSCTIPAGTYSLDNVVFQGPLNILTSSPLVVTLADGCVFTSFPTISNIIELHTVSSSPILNVTNGEVVVISMLLGAALTNSAGAAMIDVAAGGQAIISMGDYTTITGATGFPVIKGHGTSTLGLALAAGAVFASNSVAGDASTSLQVQITVPSARYSETQANFAGSLSVSQNTFIYGSASGIVQVNGQAAAGTYNFNLPTTAGSSGQVLTSAGGAASPMTWTTPTTGTVTTVSVVSANGLAGTVATATSTPAITLSTTINSPVLSGNGTAIAAATTTGSGSTVVLASGPTMTNPIVGTQSQGDGSTKAASTSYVDVAVANAIAGVNPAIAVQAATTSASNTSGFTYNNGVSGVGATFTGSVNTAVTIDGYTFTAVGQRLLVKNDTQSPSGAFNGVYSLTQLQTGILAPVFTRAADYNTPTSINNTGAIPVVNGTVNSTTSWLNTAQVVTVGTTPLVYVEFSRNPADYLLVANNLSDVASKSTSFNNLSPMTSTGDIIIGGASGTGTRLAVGTQYKVLQANATTVAYDAVHLDQSAAITGILPVGNGGTGINSTPTNGQIPIGNGTNYVAAAITAGTGITVTNGSGSITLSATNSSSTDIPDTNFNLSNNQATPANVTAFSFSTSTVRAFNALVSVSVSASSSLFEVFTLQGIYNGSSWSLAQTSNGDASLVTFTITNAGQIQYVSGNYSGFSSGKIHFRAITTAQ